MTIEMEPRELRTMPQTGLADYRRFWRHLRSTADERGIEIPPLMRNAIRNAWRDGYWAGTERT